MDPHAQLEIRRYAQTIFSIVQKVCPLACEAFEEYELGGTHFSAEECAALRAMIDGGECPLEGKERERFFAKLERRGEE
jgi:thymidylate synthase (FAD)